MLVTSKYHKFHNVIIIKFNLSKEKKKDKDASKAKGKLKNTV